MMAAAALWPSRKGRGAEGGAPFAAQRPARISPCGVPRPPGPADLQYGRCEVPQAWGPKQVGGYILRVAATPATQPVG